MIDTHTHIYLPEFDADRASTMQRAIDSGVSHLIFPNVDIETVEPMHKLHDQFPHYTSMAMGLHPTSVNENYNKVLDTILANFEQNHYVAVGEVGIDLYWDATFRKEQSIVFNQQLIAAKDKNLPVIIHCREGLDDILKVFSEFNGQLPSCVFHSFTGTIDQVKRIRQYGDFYFGINGIVTFKNSTIPLSLPEIRLDRILLETDSPYLAPVPNRGKRNESSNIPFIATKIAEIMNLTPQEISDITDKNAIAFFGI
ncbi:MAG: TatD family hydrolase [Muribaculaceae bacterium]